MQHRGASTHLSEENLSMKTALVTGAHGFLGRHIARRMSDLGYTVIGIGHGDWAEAEYRRFGLKEWHEADVTLESLEHYAGTPDIVVHCAGSGSVASSVANPHQDFLRTVGSTSAVLEFIRLRSPHAALIYPSSAAVYGNAKRLPIKECDPLEPVSPYGVHKLMAESLCESYANNFGVSVVVVRFFSVYGEGLKKQLLWDACKKIMHGERSFYGTGQETRDWLHVEDACELILKAFEVASPSCPILNGGSGIGTCVEDILSKLLVCFDRKDSPVFMGKSKAGDPAHYVADTEIARSLGWQPQTSIDQGLQRYAAWFKGS